jgi:hypothetical protein
LKWTEKQPPVHEFSSPFPAWLLLLLLHFLLVELHTEVCAAACSEEDSKHEQPCYKVHVWSCTAHKKYHLLLLAMQFEV